MAAIILTIVLLEFGLISANYLEAESNYMKPKLERNNVLNKKVWIKNKSEENLSGKNHLGQYIFRSNSINVDDVLQNNFDAFSDNFMQDIPFISSYIERSKRSSDDTRKERPRKSLKNCIYKNNCGTNTNKNIEDKSNFIETNLVQDLKPASVLNDYPYQEANLINNNKFTQKSNETTVDIPKYNADEIVPAKDYVNLIHSEDKGVKISKNKSNLSTIQPKRSNKYNYEIDNDQRIDLTSEFDNKTQKSEKSKIDRNIFGKSDKPWHHAFNLPETNIYKVVPKEVATVKPVNERGLVKVISTLTKTFKKIIKQHNDIKVIHNKLKVINNDLSTKITDISKKFEDFDKKYSNMIKLNEKIKKFEANITKIDKDFKSKHKEMSNNLMELENQQKNFLTQQKQFYTVQQLILTQNEKINLKQNAISKTQNDISQRQNNFARIIKKVKQMYVDSKNIDAKTESNFPKFENNVTEFKTYEIPHVSSTPTSSESIKFNLLSVPKVNRVLNQDEVLIKEKDQPIDDLVYKFYFNNTFIDNLIRNKILSSIVKATDNHDDRNSVKNKRSGLNTILVAINKSNVGNKSLQRNKRWINHYSIKHYTKKSIGEAVDIKEKPLKNETKLTKDIESNKTDPFLTMATSFCNEIRKNSNTQVLGWCIEKALRRLQNMNTKLFPTPPSKLFNARTTLIDNRLDATNSKSFNDVGESTALAPLTTLFNVTYKPTTENDAIYATDLRQNTIFFPDNEELESNLKQYDLKPDNEGNVYYEGSLHASETVTNSESQGYSDLLPDLNSNSKVDMSPITYKYQNRRYAFIM